ncbi:hypothetical protein VE03_00293 [Pseudogymnoascus sp. 23342-1-I1]|nr:hypothetical protein VE03_00293 [Pseudogymnoascus sp. 23342-1-I1]
MFFPNHKDRCVGILAILISTTGSSASVFRTTQTPVSTVSHTVLHTPIPTIVTTLVPRTQFITLDAITLPDETIAAKTIALDIAECSPTIAPDSNGYVPPDSCNAQYNYYPSFAAALVAAIFFGVVTFVHIAEGIKYKKGFYSVIIMGSLWEFGSYATRTISTRNQQNSGLALISQILILLAPIFINAYGYTILGRMVHFYLPSFSVLGVRLYNLTLWFVFADIACFVVQLIGGAQATNTAPPDQALRGIRIYMAGISLQETFIIVFVGFAVTFHKRLLKAEETGLFERTGKKNWRRLLYTIYLSLLLITIRIIFRLIEFAGGSGDSNPLPRREIYFYLFDAIPMFLAILIMAITPPGLTLVGPDSVIPKAMWRQRWAMRKQEKVKKRALKASGDQSDFELLRSS